MKKIFSMILIFAIGLAYLYALACRVDNVNRSSESLASNYKFNETYNY